MKRSTVTMAVAATAGLRAGRRSRRLGVQSQDRGGLSVRRQLPPGDARAARSKCRVPMVDAELELRTLTQTGEFSFTPRVRATYFPDATDLDAVDYFGTLNWEHRGQRARTPRASANSRSRTSSTASSPTPKAAATSARRDFGDSGRRAGRQPAHACEPAAVDELRTLAAPRAAVRCRLHRRELRRRIRRRAGGLHHGRRFRRPAGTAQRTQSTLTTRLRGARYDIDTRCGCHERLRRRAAVGYAHGGRDAHLLARRRAERRAQRRRFGSRVGRRRGRELARSAATNCSPTCRATWVRRRPASVVTRDQLRVRWTRAMTPRLSLLAGLRGTHDEDVDPVSTFRPRSLRHRRCRAAMALAGGILAARRPPTTPGRNSKTPPPTPRRAARCFAFIYQPLQRRRARND